MCHVSAQVCVLTKHNRTVPDFMSSPVGFDLVAKRLEEKYPKLTEALAEVVGSSSDAESWLRKSKFECDVFVLCSFSSFDSY